MEGSMKTIGKLIVAGVFVFAVLQVLRPSIPVKWADRQLQAPPDVKYVLETPCGKNLKNYSRTIPMDQLEQTLSPCRYCGLA
jgi:hypothetical protein